MCAHSPPWGPHTPAAPPWGMGPPQPPMGPHGAPTAPHGARWGPHTPTVPAMGPPQPPIVVLSVFATKLHREEGCCREMCLRHTNLRGVKLASLCGRLHDKGYTPALNLQNACFYER